ncbi:MAG: hypothetical protein U0790_23560 [Isosphaeraceae bacterium]
MDCALRISATPAAPDLGRAYCNDVMAYIPSLVVLKEGGYEEAATSMIYGQPTVWSERVEDDVISAVVRLLLGGDAPGDRIGPAMSRRVGPAVQSTRLTISFRRPEHQWRGRGSSAVTAGPSS